MSININIGANIKKFRKKLGLQANRLAEQLEISPSYLNLIESGKRNIVGNLLIKICNELSKEIDNALNDKGIRKGKISTLFTFFPSQRLSICSK